MFKIIEEEFRISDSLQASINMVTFYANILILVMHVLLFILYFLANARFMLIINTVAIIIYSYYFKRCVTDSVLYSQIAFTEIWIHMIAAVVAFGWGPGFQNWTYALVGAFFLPSLSSYKDGTSPKRPYIVGLIFIATYYILAILFIVLDIPAKHPLSEFNNHLLFTLNTLVSFVSIFTFTFFYTSIHRRKENDLLMRADYDELTNLKNRHAIKEIIDSEIDSNNTFSLAILDIDFFKKVNDTYGHQTGDAVLKHLANQMKKLERFGIISSRWGGEEFLILGPSDMSNKDFIKLIEEFRKKVESSIIKANKNIIHITLSIGVAEYTGESSIRTVVKKADNNLYEAKESGRNRIVY